MREIKRPIALSIVCILSFAAAILGFPAVFSPFIKKKGDFFPAITGIIIAFEFISVVGVWYMKKWGFRVYLTTAILNQCMLLYINNWSQTKIILPVIFIAVSAFFYKKMDHNL
ncbi:MAG: hypothetical protein ACK5P4_13345 [Bacteroidota bacterium]|jgi:hypothetical protein